MRLKTNSEDYFLILKTKDMFTKEKLNERRTELLKELRSRLFYNGSFKKWGLICEDKSSDEDLLHYLKMVKTLNLVVFGVLTVLLVWGATSYDIAWFQAPPPNPSDVDVTGDREAGVMNALPWVIALLIHSIALAVLYAFRSALRDWMATRK
jgi:hypothetical protein